MTLKMNYFQSIFLKMHRSLLMNKQVESKTYTVLPNLPIKQQTCSRLMATGYWKMRHGKTSVGTYSFFCLWKHVHGSHVDIPAQLLFLFLQFLKSLTSFFWIVSFEIISRVWLTKKVLFWSYPFIILLHFSYLKIYKWRKHLWTPTQIIQKTFL